MAVKAVDLVRLIRDKLYEKTKDLSVEEQIEYIRREARELQKEMQASVKTAEKSE